VKSNAQTKAAEHISGLTHAPGFSYKQHETKRNSCHLSLHACVLRSFVCSELRQPLSRQRFLVKRSENGVSPTSRLAPVAALGSPSAWLDRWAPEDDVSVFVELLARVVLLVRLPSLRRFATVFAIVMGVVTVTCGTLLPLAGVCCRRRLSGALVRRLTRYRLSSGAFQNFNCL